MTAGGAAGGGAIACRLDANSVVAEVLDLVLVEVPVPAVVVVVVVVLRAKTLSGGEMVAAGCHNLFTGLP